MDQWRLEFYKVGMLLLLVNIGILRMFVISPVRDSIPELSGVIVYLFMINPIDLVHLKLIAVDGNVSLDFSTQLMYCSVNYITNSATNDICWDTTLS